MSRQFNRSGARWAHPFAWSVRFAAFALLLLGAVVACSAEVGGGPESESLGSSSQALTTADVWNFENPARWSVTTSGSVTKQSSTIHDEGANSLQLTSASFVAVRGDGVSKPASISPFLAVDIMIPTQAGPYYMGALQMMLSVPSLNIYSQWINQRELSVPTGVWQTLSFEIPDGLSGQLQGSSFNDLQMSLGLNPPAGLNQPFRLDNLRFVPAPSCIGQLNGTLCDDSVTCTTGSSCNAGVCGSVTTIPPGGACDPGDDVMGFENFPAWRGTNGAAALAPSTTHVQGLRSLQINTPYFMTVSSIRLATLHKVSSTLSLRVQKPIHQPNPSWHGDLTLNLSVPSLGINFSMTKPLTGQPSGSFFELQFALPTATYQALANSGYNDLTFSVSINPPNGQVGAYLLDDLHFVPVASCAATLNNTACEDNSACTQGDACRNGVCGATLTCNDSNVCTNDSCSPAVGCVFTPNTASCSDSNACTTGDVCSNGVCVPGAATNCDDGSNCTTDACAPATGCTHASACGGGVCFANACCQPKTCADLHAECGTFGDDCGGAVDCTASCPAGGTCNPDKRCLPPNDFNQPSGINVCERLVEKLVIPPTFDDVLTCDCSIFNPPQCCVPGVCLGDPLCTILSHVQVTPEQIYNAGDVYCSVNLTPQDYLERLLSGRLTDYTQVEDFLLTGGTAALFDFHVAVMTQAGRQAPSNARNIIHQLVAPLYDGGVTGFSFDDLDNVKIVSSNLPTAGFYLPGDRRAITLGPVIVMKAPFYDALFKDSNSNVGYPAFVTGSTTCPLYIAAVNILVHELSHVRQYRQLGRYTFTKEYLAQAAAAGYGGIGFEQEAFEYEIKVAELQGGRYCAVMSEDDNQLINKYNLNVPLNTCTPSFGGINNLPPCP